MISASLTTIMPNNSEIIASPLSSFNNFIVKISDEVNEIFYPDSENNYMLNNNQIIFEDFSMTIFNFIKIYYENSEILFKFTCGLNDEKMDIVEHYIENKQELIAIFKKYLFIISEVAQNYDDDISQKYVKTIFDKVRKISGDSEMFLLPYKNKINHLFDANDETLRKLYHKFSYGVVFTNNKTKVNYKLLRVLSSDLDESKSIENIRFLEKETIKSGTISMCSLNQFLIKLYYYGEI